MTPPAFLRIADSASPPPVVVAALTAALAQGRPLVYAGERYRQIGARA